MSMCEKTVEIETFSHFENSNPIKISYINSPENNRIKKENHSFTPFVSIENLLNKMLVSYPSSEENHENHFKAKSKSYSPDDFYYHDISDISDFDLDS